MLAKNKASSPTHFQLLIPTAKPQRRWVAIACGKVLKKCPTTITSPVKKASHNEYLLALSWQPSFCEGHQKKPECKTLTAQRFDAQHLSLHGLWPQPRDNAYCQVSIKDKSIDRRGRWDLLAPLMLSTTVKTELKMVMPGFVSHLQRHEWIKHGTCYGKPANAYYADAIRLLQAVNHSSISALFREHIGKSLSIKQIRQQFDQSFGVGSGEKVNLRCDRKGRISELWINLKGEVLTSTSLSSLLKSASTTRSNCQQGLVDPV